MKHDSITNGAPALVRASLFVALAVACLLRLYRLDTPSMWLDEILVPMAAAHPMDYIFDLCRHVEVHPPGYYLFTKLILACGVSDFALRIGSALCGIATVYMTYLWVRELAGPPQGVLAAAFLAVNPLHVYDSRAVRPYALFLAVLLLGLIFLCRYLRQGRIGDLIRFSLANATLILLHYSALLLTGAAGLLLAWDWLVRRRREEFKALACFSGISLAAFALDIPFFLGRVEKTHKGQFMGFDFVQATANTAGKLLEVVHMYKDWALRIALAVLVAAGALRLLRGAGREGRAVLVLAFVPVVMLLATKYDYYAYNVWHLSFLLPFFACMAGCALPAARPAWTVLAAAAMALGAGSFLLTAHHADYYEQDSAILPFFVLSKPAARELAGRIVPGDIAAVTDFGIFNGINWYTDQFASVNPLTVQRLKPGTDTVRIKYVSGLGQFGGLAKNEAEFLAKVGAPESVEELKQLKIFTLPVQREPGLGLDALPGKASVRAGLKEFYAKADSLADLTFDSNWEGAFCPTTPGKNAHAAFHVENAAGNAPQLLTVGVRYVNEGRGNTLKVICRFDDEPEWLAVSSQGPDPSGLDLAIVERRKPYSRLDIRCELTLAPLTARFPGGNQETLGLREVFVRAEELR